MIFSNEIVRERFKEAIGNDSQEVVAEKLHMTQGNVSKLLSGKQLPTLDTAFNISKSYGVSVDWLIGLTDKKRVSNAPSEMSYSEITEAVIELRRHGGCSIEEYHPSGNVCLHITEPLLKKLIVKGGALIDADEDSFDMWKEYKLSMFDDKSLIWARTWHMKDVYGDMLAEMTSETDWVKVYESAIEFEQELEEIYK